VFILLHHLQRLRRSIDLDSPRRRGSLAMRHVDCGSCNGCEHELAATANPFYDLQRYGLNIVASPRHADILLVTGVITTHMTRPLQTAYEAMPEPRLVAALGDCALGCNRLGSPEDLAAPLEELLHVDVRIPGCPPTPHEIANHLIALLDQRAGKHPA
jgi:Ni,Fe-hydrogenase III small subunit